MRIYAHYVTDLFDQDADRKYSGLLTGMVTFTQLFGLLLIILGLTILKDFPEHLAHVAYILWIIAGAILLLMVAYCWRDEVLNLYPRWREEDLWTDSMPEAARKTLLLRATLILIVVDTLLLTVLVIISGGPGRSPLDPLLPVIAIIAMVLRQPPRTVFVALWSGFVFIIAFVLHWSADIFGLPHGHSLAAYWIHDSHSDPNYPLAFGIVSGGAVLMSVIEYKIARITPELGKGLNKSVEFLLGRSKNFRGFSRSVRRGTKTWIKWLEHRDLPIADLSLVHEPQEVVRQAVILGIPEWLKDQKHKRKVIRHITFLTFAAHWVDDHFDALRIYCRDETLREAILESDPVAVLETHYTRLEELVGRMERAVKEVNRAQVKRAVIRIIYGGLIQNARSKTRLDYLLGQYVAFVCADLNATLRTT